MAALDTLATAFRENRTFKSLFLRYDSIDDRGAISLGKFLRATESLTSLNLTFNVISDIGALALAEALAENKSLTSLDLRWNNIDADGISALLEAKSSSTTLKELLLEGNVGSTNVGGEKRGSKTKSIRGLGALKSMRADKPLAPLVDVGVNVGDWVDIPGYADSSSSSVIIIIIIIIAILDILMTQH